MINPSFLLRNNPAVRPVENPENEKRPGAQELSAR